MGGGTLRRSFSRDQSVRDAKIAPGTAKRILHFAAPYKKVLFVFLLLSFWVH